MAGCIEVYNVEACVVGIKNRGFRFDDEKEDQGGDPEENYNDAEDQTDDGAAPDGGVRMAVSS